MSERSNPIKMIDVSGKEVVHREAEATGRINLKGDTIEKIRSGEIEKGDPLPAAEIACILAVKKTPNIIPLCHPIPVTSVDAGFHVADNHIEARCRVTADYKTGVEMEALTGVAAALLTIWDMVKYLEKDGDGQYPSTVITDLKVTEKEEGLNLDEHRRDQKVEAVVALMVTSDSRTIETDETGKTGVCLLEAAGHRVSAHVIVPNDIGMIHEAYTGFLGDPEVQVIITSGGTGISSRDKTVSVVSATFEKPIPGFGELFRRLSFDEIGHAAMFSRATAGAAQGKLVFCLPGSRGAMETALEKIILPSLGHTLWELSR